MRTISSQGVINNIFRTMFDITSYFFKYPIKSLTYLLLFNQICQALGNENARKMTPTEAINYLKENSDDLLTIEEKVDRAIHQHKYTRVETFLDMYLESSPDDIEFLQDKLRLAIYRAYNTEHNLYAFKQYEGLVKHLLSLDKDNEFALSVDFLLNMNENPNINNFVHSEKPKLRFAISYFARAYFNVRRGKNMGNVALLFSVVEDLAKAIELERDDTFIALYKKLQGDAKRSQNELLEDTNYFIDFLSLYGAYDFDVNVKNAYLFNHTEGNSFKSDDIKLAIQNHFPLLISFLANLPSVNLPPLEKQYNPGALLAYGSDFYLYEATMSTDYHLTLTAEYQHRTIVFPKSMLHLDFLVKNVNAMISPHGYIITSSNALKECLEGYQEQQNNFKKSKNQSRINIIQKPQEDVQWSTYLLPMGSLLTSGIVLKKVLNFINTGYYARKQRLAREKAELKLSEELLRLITEIHADFEVDTPIWSLHKSGSCVTLTADKEEVLKQRRVRVTSHKFLKKYPELQQVSFEKTLFEKWWIKKLRKFFGESNVSIVSELISIKLDFALLPDAQFLKPRLTKLSEELFELIISNSPEFKLLELHQDLKRLNDELVVIEGNFQDFWCRNQSVIANIKMSANQNANISHHKVNELINICTVLENQFVDGFSIDTYKQQLKSLLEQSDKVTAISEIQTLKGDFNVLVNNVNNLKSRWLDINIKFSSIKDLFAFLEKAKVKLEEQKKKEHINNSSAMFSKKSNKVETKQLKETEEEKAQRIAKYKQQKALLQTERLKKQEAEKKKKIQMKMTEEKIQTAVKKSEEISILKNDPLLAMLEHQIEMISQALALYYHPDENDTMKFLSGNASLFQACIKKAKIFAEYIMLMGLAKGNHSLGQMMVRYEKYFILDVHPYMVRNVLLHKFWHKEIEHSDTLISGATEFIERFQNIIVSLRTIGFPTELSKIFMSSSLFADDFLKSILESELDLTSLLNELIYHFENLVFMSEVVTHICNKSNEIYVDHCGLLHQTITSCISLIGVLLNDLKKLDKLLYQTINKSILQFENLTLQGKEKATKTVFQNIKIKVGHVFGDKKSYSQEQNIYKEASPALLSRICHDSTKLYKQILPIIESKLKNLKLNPESEPFLPSFSNVF